MSDKNTRSNEPKTDSGYTPTPWNFYVGSRSIVGPNGISVATCSGVRKRADRDAYDKGAFNGAHIVRCVNAHDELVAALLTTTDQLELLGGMSDEVNAFIVNMSRTVLAKLEAS